MNLSEIDMDMVLKNPFVVGASGAFIAAWRFIPGTGLPSKFGNALAGTAIAGYIAPAITEWLGKPTYTGAAAFILGLVGMSLADALIRAIKETQFGQILTGWLTRRS